MSGWKNRKNRGGILENAQKIEGIVFINEFTNNSGEMAIRIEIFGDQKNA